MSSHRINVAGLGCPAEAAEDIETQTEVGVQIENISESVESKNYKYTVSAGQISGEGRNIWWNLKGVKPGSYSITVEVNQNGKILTATNSINVVRVDCCGYCECARVLINASATEIKKGETLRFQILIEDGTQNNDDLRFDWKITGGKILDGKGTNEIVVEADPNNKTELTATVEVNGLCMNCPNTDSVTVKIIDK
ncbi:MAG TPA: hypothetical protein PKY59_15100 [Pyrinomonadaceae bacterium]|nr:hypothetical protein [Pyrinomonadaceae bacterium]